MLTSLLPGLRDLRAPLAAGYLWLVVGWLALSGHIPSEREATGIFRAIYDLAPLLSIVGTALAVSFAAYLLGALSEAAFTRALDEIGGRILGRYFYRITFAWAPRDSRLFSIQAEGAILRLARAAVERLERAQDPAAVVREVFPPLADTVKPWSKDESRRWEDHLVASIVSELRLVEKRLIGKENELYGEADRLRGEAEFREAIIPPLAALVVVAAVEQTWFWVAGFIPIGALYWQAARRTQARYEVLVDALAVDRVEAPTLERLRLALEKAEEPPGTQRGASVSTARHLRLTSEPTDASAR